MAGYFEYALKGISPEKAAEIDASIKAFHELNNSVDRVTAIVGCAVIDNSLKDAIQRRLTDNERALKKFFDDKEGPGHDTSAKIQLAHLLGVFSDETRTNLEAITSIRNKFAHRLYIRDFDHQELKQLFERITSYKRIADLPKLALFGPQPIPDNASRKARFVATVDYLHFWFQIDEFTPIAAYATPHF